MGTPGYLPTEGVPDEAGTVWSWTVTEGMVTGSDGGQGGPRGVVVTESCRYYSFFMKVLLEVVIVVVGVAGNSITVKALYRDLHKSATMFCIFCLALADILLLLVYGIISIPSNMLTFLGRGVEARWVSHHTSVYFSSAVGPTCIMISMGFTVAVTWQRYVSVCMPYKVKTYCSIRVAQWQAVCIVIFSVLFNFPRWFEYELVVSSSGMTQRVPSSLYNSASYQMVYGVILYYLMFYIVPLSALAYMTVSLVRSLRQHRAKQASLQVAHSSARAHRELTLSLIVVVIVFITCHFFGPARRILLLLFPNPSHRNCGGINYYFGAISLGATMLNSAANFIIFLLCARRFRKQVRAMCVCGRGHKVQDIPHEVTERSGMSIDVKPNTSATLPTRVIRVTGN